VGKPEGKEAVGRSRSRREDNIKWIFSNWNKGHGLVRSSSGYGQVAGTCECGNEHCVP
jgi:hypothetical protein